MKISRKQKVMAATGSIEDMIDAVENHIGQLEHIDEIGLATDIDLDDEIEEACDKDVYGEDDIEECDDVAFV